MGNLKSHLRRLFLLLPAAWLGLAPLAWAAGQGEVQVAEADCYSVGQQVAAENGGTLAKAQRATRGGREVCVIVVLVPARDGERPRRTEIVVPAN
ncbi:MAG: hypothetical protein J0H34_07890 [Rhizobiales bacterium]|nr:hypothetical protein [Hyphomicrobiales bacterium]